MKIAQAVEQLQPSYIREILSDATAKGVISLAGGLPATSSFPMELIASSLTNLATRRNLFQYGQTAGFGPLVEFLKQSYQMEDNSDLLVSTGSQQGLDLIARGFIEKGNKVVVEEPAYLGALQVFALAQANIQAVAQTQNGPDLQQLQQLFATGEIKLFYAVPDFHNPTGVCWSLQVRITVAQLCQKYGVTLIEDAPYRDIRFYGEELPMVSSFCPERSLVLRSFSKIAAPGMRLGCVTGPKPWVQTLMKIKQCADLHSSVPMQAVLLDLLMHKGFPHHLKRIIDLYRLRQQAMVKAINFHLSCEHNYDCEFNPVAGGMFIWLKFKNGSAMTIAKRSLKNGVAVVPSNVFYMKSKSGSDKKATTNGTALRLNFSHASEQDIEEGIKRLVPILISEIGGLV